MQATYLGGNAVDRLYGVALDGTGRVFSAGFTRSSNFPLAGFEPSPIGDIGAYKSTDGGAQWAPAMAGLRTPSLTALAVDPVTPGVIYAGAENDGVFKSVDGGANWQPSSAGLTSLFVTALVIDPVTPSTLYAGTAGGGVFKSYDSGATWNPVNTSLSIRNIVSLAIDPTNPSILYAGTLVRGAHYLYKSVNGAASWAPIFGYEINAAAVDPSASATVYAASHTLLFKSVDGGSTWTQVFREPLSTYYISAVLIDPSQPSTVYVGTLGNGVFKTTDSGATWRATSTGLPWGVSALVLDPNQPATLFAGTAGTGVFKSVNGGETWFASNTGLSRAFVTQLAVDPRMPSRLYAAADGLRGDAFVSVLGPDGDLVFSSYAGGSENDFAASIGVSGSGRAYITGRTNSLDWPTSVDATQSVASLNTNAFFARLRCLPPVVSEASVNPTLLWPPDHRMVPVSLSYTASGWCGSVNCSLLVTSNEPANGAGDGDAEPDAQVVDAQNVLLRAERSALGTGRIYKITITCTDAAGQRGQRTVKVTVPLSSN